MESLRQDPELEEGSDVEDVGFHSDEEDIRINGQTASEDSMHLRFLNVVYLLIFFLFGIEE